MNEPIQNLPRDPLPEPRRNLTETFLEGVKSPWLQFLGLVAISITTILTTVYQNKPVQAGQDAVIQAEIRNIKEQLGRTDAKIEKIQDRLDAILYRMRQNN